MKNWHYAFLFFAVVALVFAIYYTNKPVECYSFECWQKNMESCSFAKYVNEEPQASWGYEVVGREGNKCKVIVTLLTAKEGDLSLRGYEGKTMTCAYPEGKSAYPEKDLTNCHGELKEDLQSLIIKKLQEYVVEKLNEINVTSL